MPTTISVPVRVDSPSDIPQTINVPVQVGFHPEVSVEAQIENLKYGASQINKEIDDVRDMLEDLEQYYIKWGNEE